MLFTFLCAALAILSSSFGSTLGQLVVCLSRLSIASVARLTDTLCALVHNLKRSVKNISVSELSNLMVAASQFRVLSAVPDSFDRSLSNYHLDDSVIYLFKRFYAPRGRLPE